MPALRIQITKRTDGGAVLECVRADGTETWQKQQSQSAAFFPLHDLTHYAVETELGISEAFYGLIASGWSIHRASCCQRRTPRAETADGRRARARANAQGRVVRAVA